MGVCFLPQLAIYINNLVLEIKQTALGVRLNDFTVGILLLADEIVLQAKTENDIQNLLNILYCWCSKLRLKINKDQTQVMHFGKKAELNLGSTPLSYINLDYNGQGSNVIISKQNVTRAELLFCGCA